MKKLIIVTIASLLVISPLVSAFAKANNANKPAAGSMEERLKGYEKPKPTTSNAELHVKKIKNVADNLDAVAEDEETLGNEETADDLEEVADEQDVTVEDVGEAMEEIESRPRWKTILLGADYKNLGQLRSSLVQNKNQIRKLTKNANQVQGEDNQNVFQEQIQTLTQERERIKDIITENEEDLGILGWVLRFLSGYPQEEIVEEEEEELIEEVLGVMTQRI